MMRILAFNCDQLSSTICLHSFKLIDSHKCSNTSGSMKTILYCPVQINEIKVAVLDMLRQCRKPRVCHIKTPENQSKRELNEYEFNSNIQDYVVFWSLLHFDSS